MRQISIIIVNYNTRQLLSDCIETIRTYTDGIDFEIIVVDNGSSDGSEEYITNLYPDIIWIDSGDNIGFGKANNLGAKHSKGEYLFFLNSDTILKNNALQYFVEYMHSREADKIGILGGYLHNGLGNASSSYGRFPSPISEIEYVVARIWRRKKADNAAACKVDWVSGADMFIKRSLFEDIGGFDPMIFMYYEETDLQYRLSEAGYNQYVIPGPEIIHFESGSAGGRGLTYRKFIMSQRSYNYYIRKHFKGLKYIAYRLFMCVYRLTIFITTDWSLREKFEAYASVLSGRQR